PKDAAAGTGQPGHRGRAGPTTWGGSAMSRCPPGEELLHLLAEQLGESQREALEGHVETCPACQGRLAELTGGAVDRVGRRGGGPGRGQEGFRRHAVRRGL